MKQTPTHVQNMLNMRQTSVLHSIVIIILKKYQNSIVVRCYIPNSKTCLKHVWLQYNIKSLQLFGLICVQNSIGSLVLYNGLNSTKSPQLFHFLWVKICSHIHLYPLSNYLLQTSQIYSDFMWSFPLSYIVFH